MVKLQARELARLARRNNIKLTKGLYNSFPGCNKLCPIGMLQKHLNIYRRGDDFYQWYRDLASAVGHPVEDMRALEFGFEGWDFDDNPYSNNRYFSVGQRLRRLTKGESVLN